MPNAKHDDEVIRAAMHLEFVANTPGPNLDGSSFEEILTDMILRESGCMVYREDAVDHDCDGWVEDDDEWFPGVGGIVDAENM